MRKFTIQINCLAIILFFSFTTLISQAQKITTDANVSADLSIVSLSQLDLKMMNQLGSIDVDIVGMTEGDYARLLIPKYAKSQEVGSPDLPVRRQLIEIPAGAEPVVRIIGYDENEYSLSDYGIKNQLIPLQPPQPKCGNDPDFICNTSIYKMDKYISNEIVTVDVLGYLRGVRIARVNISPVSYNPVKNTIRVYENLEFEITFKNADLSQTEYLKRKLYSPYFTGLYKTLANYSQPAVRENLTKYPVKYVIISDRMFEAQLEPFIEWKTKKGFDVVEAYTDEIGTTKSEIKDYIQDLYDEGTEEDPAPSFILFVGDIAQIPTWDNGNGVTDRNYVEYTSDLFPEIFYGRFSAENTTQLQPYIDKTLQYEQFTMPDPSYLEYVVMIAGMDSGHGNDWGNGQINYGTINYFNEEHDISSYTYLYPESGSNSANIIQNISDGVTFANYTAHCGPSGWSDPSFNTSDIAGLQNQDMYGLLIGNCCSSSEYQTTCFAEAIVRAENKGAVGYIGGSNSTFWDEDYYFGVGVGEISEDPPDYEETTLGNYDRSFHDHGEVFGDWYVTQDQIVFAGNLAVSESGTSAEEYYWDIYNLIGDPSLMIYYGVPEEIETDYDPFIMIGATTFAINTVPYAYVVLNNDGERKAVALADENGLAELEFDSFTSPGFAEIVITAQNYQPYIEDVLVIAPEGPYCIYKEHSLNDDSLGNGNSKAEFDEEVFLNITIENYGTDDAIGTDVTITSDNPFVSIIDKDEYYDTIRTGKTASIEDGFCIKLADNVPDQAELVLNIEVTDGMDSTWYSDLQITAFAPVLSPEDLVVEDEDGNGRLDPGEEARIVIKTANTGHCVIYDVNALLVSYNPYITVTSPDTTIPVVGLFGAAYPGFNVLVSEDAPEGVQAEMHYYLSSGGYETFESYFPKVGLMLEDWETGDFDKYDWDNGVIKPWTINNLYPFEGFYDARSGDITDYQSSEISIAYKVMTSDSISFYKKVSSEADYDKLIFYIDNVQKASWSGTSEGWTRESFPITAGNHMFKWEYTKDANTSVGADCAWLDYIILPTEMTTTVFAGPDDEVCENQMYFQCYGSATNYDSIYWTSAGTGTFNNDNLMSPQYYFSEADLENGEILLSLSLVDVDGEFASDTMHLMLQAMAEKPDKPKGPEYVDIEETTQSEYVTNEAIGADYFTWFLNPETAGLISGEGTIGTVEWDTNFGFKAWVKVAGVNNCGMGVYSDSLLVEISNPVGFNELKDEVSVAVVPNPNNGQFSLSVVSGSIGIAFVTIVDQFGQTMVNREKIILNQTSDLSYNLSNVRSGIYFVIIETEKRRFVEKLLIKK